MAKYVKPKYGQAAKDAYLAYFEKAKAKGLRPLTFAHWLRTQKQTKGLSRQTRQQLQGLSKADYKAVSKYLK